MIMSDYPMQHAPRPMKPQSSIAKPYSQMPGDFRRRRGNFLKALREISRASNSFRSL
jgi:hypothetical protein